ncbi:MAG: nuclear transport factor 2 family protein [Anaerolineales bacterium]|nr:nuclear transport factor 2 family protein [Anaerolineales bacterium]
MSKHEEIQKFLIDHLNTVRENDIEGYHATTAEDLTLYEWWVTPNRIDGLGFHDFLLEENARKGTTFGSESDPGVENSHSRFDLSNLKIQRYDDTAIASYTLLITTASSAGIKVASHNESRVMVKLNGQWKVVHVHKSPSWHAPHQPE